MRHHILLKVSFEHVILATFYIPHLAMLVLGWRKLRLRKEVLRGIMLLSQLLLYAKKTSKDDNKNSIYLAEKL